MLKCGTSTLTKTTEQTPETNKRNTRDLKYRKMSDRFSFVLMSANYSDDSILRSRYRLMWHGLKILTKINQIAQTREPILTNELIQVLVERH